MPTNSKSKAKTKLAKQVPKTSVISKIRLRVAGYLKRRPHRSFRRTRRRDYVRPLNLPGIFAFTIEVTMALWRRRKIFLPLIVIYVVLYAILVGVGSQDTYNEISDFLKNNGSDFIDGDFGVITQSAVMVGTIFTTGINGEMTETQQIFGVILGLMVWLTTVWLLRNSMAGHKIKMRDGLYSAGSPIIATFLVLLVIAVQLLPVAIAALGYSAATASGLISGGGMPAMLFWAAAGLLALLSLYWITSSLFALIIVTLPGTYPMKALKISGEIVTSRRIKILLRFLWMIVCVAIFWAGSLAIVVLLDMGVRAIWPSVTWLPLVPVGLLIVSTLVVFWSSAYVYLLYRRVVDSEPAK